MNLRLATRGSALALAQTREVARRLREAWPGLDVQEKIFRTTGDRNLEVDLAVAGALDKGLFTKELEEALLGGRADAAVHSLKDLPVVLPEGLAVGAVLPREDTADILVTHGAGGLDELPSGAKVGTGSPRRRAMLLAARGDLVAAPIRGNVPTRLAKLAAGDFDAIILAAAGLRRLGMAAEGALIPVPKMPWPLRKSGGTAVSPSRRAPRAGGTAVTNMKPQARRLCSLPQSKEQNIPRLDMTLDGVRLHATRLEGFLPAPGQGAIAVEIRADDAQTADLLCRVHDHDTDAAVRAERAVLEALGGGCHMALGARATVAGGMIELQAVVFDASGAAPKYASANGRCDEPEFLGRAVAAQLHGG